MKKITLFAALLLTTAFASAQIVRGTIGNGNYTDYSGYTSTKYGIDFDNDGELEVVIKDGNDYEFNDCENCMVEYLDTKMHIVGPASTPEGGYWDVFLLLNQGDIVNPFEPSYHQSMTGYGDGFFENINDVSATKSYVGFVMQVGNNYYFGYAKIHRSGNAIVWDEVYYNSSAEAGIACGSTSGGVSINEVRAINAPAARKVYFHGHLYIERDGILYDLMGRRVK